MHDDQSARDQGAPTPMRGGRASDAPPGELIERFLDDMFESVDALHRAWEGREMAALSSIARRLEEAGRDSGRPMIEKRAAALERAALTNEAAASALGEQVEALIRMCREACGGDGA